jgi:type VI secretion system protein ImpF
MARPSIDSAVTLSVIDRLIDYEPRVSSEPQMPRAQSVRLLKDSVRRDLEWLLNTRRIAEMPDERLRELNKSVYVYGLPDFTAYSLSAPKDQAKLLRALSAAIKQFEPRLANVKINDLDQPDMRTRTLHLRIEALLLMDPSPEHISFDTVLELASGQYEVGHAG